MAEGDYFVNGIKVRADGAVYTTTTANMADLANTSDAAKGDALIGVKLDATGAVATTQHERNEKFGFLDELSSAANFNTFRDALTGTVGLPPAIEVSHGANVTDYPFTIRTANAQSADFNMAIGDFLNGATTNTVFRQGYNVAPGGARRDTNEPAWFWSQESNYESGGQNYMEWHWEGVHPDGTTFRNWSWAINRSTKQTIGSAGADIFNFQDRTLVNPAFAFNATTISGKLSVNAGSTIDIETNASGGIRQKNFANSGFIQLILANISDEVVLAPGGGGTLTGGKLSVNNSGLGSTALNVYSTASGTLSVLQKDNTTSGQVVLNVVSGSAITGSVDLISLAGNSTGDMRIYAQQNGNGRTLYDAMVVGTGDAASRYYVNGAGIWSVGIDNSDSDKFKISGNAALGTSDAIVIDAALNVGIGHGTFGTNAASVFSVKNGTAPTTGPADTVQFYSSDDAAGHTVPSFFCEGTNVVATGQADSASSVRIKMRVNGTVYTLLAI